MARPPKSKLDYSSWSVDIFDTDTKIDKLIDAYGWEGFGVYFYLCQRAYGSEGYYYRWDYDDAATTARKMGGIDSDTIIKVVGFCLDVGLFEKSLFTRWKILTSRGIQDRYYEATQRRTNNRVFSDFWLLSDCDGLVFDSLDESFCNRNEGFCNENEGFCNNNSGFCNENEGFCNIPFSDANINVDDVKQNVAKVKESKVKESKVKEIKEKKNIQKENVDRVVDAWNSLGLAKVTKVPPNSARERQLNARLKEHGIDGVLEAIDKVRQSEFLMGKSSGWRCTFDWLINASNMIKVLEGNYDDKPKPAQKSRGYNRKEEQLAKLLEDIRADDESWGKVEVVNDG